MLNSCLYMNQYKMCISLHMIHSKFPHNRHNHLCKFLYNQIHMSLRNQYNRSPCNHLNILQNRNFCMFHHNQSYTRPYIHLYKLLHIQYYNRPYNRPCIPKSMNWNTRYKRPLQYSYIRYYIHYKWSSLMTLNLNMT